MAVIPIIPVFEAGDWYLFRLQQLSAAVAFACRVPVVFHLYKTANESLLAGVQTPVTWDAASADSDGGWSAGSPSRYTAQTPGYFHLDAGVNCTTTAVDGQLLISLRATTGPVNPAGAGVVTWFASRSDDAGILSQQESLALSATSPYLYAGDYVEVMALSTNAQTLTAGWNNSGNNDLNGFPDGSPSFTGMLVSLGP